MFNQSTPTPAAPTIGGSSVDHQKPRLNILGGGTDVTYDQLTGVPLPPSTDTYKPIHHHRLVRLLKDACRYRGVEIIDEKHKLNASGKHYFGLFAIRPTDSYREAVSKKQGVYQVLGLRNSHNKMFPAGVMGGDAPFVCSNLCFDNEIVFGRRHTKNFFRDIDGLVLNAVTKTIDLMDATQDRNQTYIEQKISDIEANDLIIKSLRSGAVNARDVAKVADYYHNKQDGFEDRSLWSLKNAFSAQWRSNVWSNGSLASRLHNVFDDFILSKDDTLLTQPLTSA